MKNQTSRYFRLVNPQIAENCFKSINDYVAKAVKEGKTATVILDFEDKSDRARTLAQNRIYWLWVAYIAQYEGNNKDTQHAMLKRSFLSKILCRSSPELVPLFESVKNCEKHMNVAEYNNFALGVAKLLSTTKASVAEMTEYLNDIERFYFGKGLALPIPDELKWCKE